MAKSGRHRVIVMASRPDRREGSWWNLAPATIVPGETTPKTDKVFTKHEDQQKKAV